MISSSPVSAKVQKVHSYRDLIVWQKAMDLVVALYKLTKDFPKNEEYGLKSQMRRSAVSIPSNIAEGRMRGSRKMYLQFVNIAYSSGGELETQVELSKRLTLIKEGDPNLKQVESLLNEVMRMLNKVSSTLRS